MSATGTGNAAVDGARFSAGTPPADKRRLVDHVFSSVSARYDLMNDLMSMGTHRLWKRQAVFLGSYCRGQHVLDLAGGSGDMTRLIAPRVGPEGRVWLADASAEMLDMGMQRTSHLAQVSFVRCRAEDMPFEDGSFDQVMVAFGLRNFSDQPAALREIYRVLRPGGCVQVLEFSRIAQPLRQPYRCYLNTILPLLGSLVAGDEGSYRYLAESIELHPDQDQLSSIMLEAGFLSVDWLNFSAGIVALHQGFRGL